MNQKVLTISEIQQFEFPCAVQVWVQSVRGQKEWEDKKEVMSFRRLLLQDYLPTLTCLAIRNERQQILGMVGIANKQVFLLSVLPNYQRQGLAKRLLDFAIDEYGAHKAEIPAKNEAALALFHAQGFYSVARHDKDALNREKPWYQMIYF
ncbi:GNAT family N-acetyltransferase [Thaumasiovibrio subtropicus]|uniref:GNAT family N-acetyltransferase n=1 Tax=Thaumasiovibrio subtropicus TaxID=1891207 RepID=UPI000B34F139|nr:GNAT family N-acetyltransferase [Thaumasiovibrio subtropicus]